MLERIRSCRRMRANTTLACPKRLVQCRSSRFTSLGLALLFMAACTTGSQVGFSLKRHSTRYSDSHHSQTNDAVTNAFGSGTSTIRRRAQEQITTEEFLGDITMVIEGVSTPLSESSVQLWFTPTINQINDEILKVLGGVGSVSSSINYSSIDPQPADDGELTNDTPLTIVFDLTTTIESVETDHDIAQYVQGAFDSEDDQTLYLQRLIDTEDPAFQQVSNVAVTVPQVTTEAPAVAPTAEPATTDSPAPTPTVTLPPNFTTTSPTEAPTNAPTSLPAETDSPTTSAPGETDAPTDSPTIPPSTETPSSIGGPSGTNPPTSTDTGAPFLPTQSPSPEPTSPNGTNSPSTVTASNDNTGLIIGLVLAGTVSIALIAFLLGFVARTRVAKSDVPHQLTLSPNSGSPQGGTKGFLSVVEIPEGQDDISTLGDPATIGVPFTEDTSVPGMSMIDYDFAKAYGKKEQPLGSQGKPLGSRGKQSSAFSLTTSDSSSKGTHFGGIKFHAFEQEEIDASDGDSLEYSESDTNTNLSGARYEMPNTYQKNTSKIKMPDSTLSGAKRTPPQARNRTTSESTGASLFTEDDASFEATFFD